MLSFELVKRAFDFAIALSACLALSPLLVALAFMIWLTQGNVIFFRQLRPGKHGKPFKIYKFCTMTNCCDQEGCLLPDSQRLTKVGKLLRSTSLDELPELFNVINGEMSIVGPRPLLMQYLDRYTPEQARRHDVRPGLTGWAQINGRNAISWEEKFKLDVWYVDHQSLRLDLKIIALTLLKVIKREGISQEGHATMEEFRGNDKQIALR
ncbi:MAG: sugar transferase [Syntrophobacteraceae bacterium CG2_30_61_12]|nr:MAG: sugar transferase [Syntrophobacteraceae bacterium CG2_30_61_12]PIU31082.1 MAG: sugar transferase [Syntrophobacteraceae bacterium CG07_land_8_20_14_0_80_61_8]